MCLVGASRNYLPSDEDQAEERRAHYIQSRSAGSAAGVKGQGSCAPKNSNINETNQDSAVEDPQSGWGAGFRPRDKVEMVRNCAALPRVFVEAVVLQVATALLNMTAEDSHTADWNPGGKDRTDSEQQFQCSHCHCSLVVLKFCAVPGEMEAQLTAVTHPNRSSSPLSSITH